MVFVCKWLEIHKLREEINGDRFNTEGSGKISASSIDSYFSCRVI